MESKRGYEKLINGYGYQRENLTWPQDPLFWNEMDINDLEKEI